MIQRASSTPFVQAGGSGAVVTVRFALADLVVSIVSRNRLLVVFVYVPTAEAVTFTEIVQLPFAATVPFANEIDDEPAFAVSVGVPQPVVVAAGVLATVMFAGSG